VKSAFFISRGKVAHLRTIEDVFATVSFDIAFEKETLLFFHCIREAIAAKSAVDNIIREEQDHISWLNEFGKMSVPYLNGSFPITP